MILSAGLIGSPATWADDPASCDGLDPKTCHERVVRAYAGLQSGASGDLAIFASACRNDDVSACAVYASLIHKKRVPGISDYSGYFDRSKLDRLEAMCDDEKDALACVQSGLVRMFGLGVEPADAVAFSYFDKGCALNSAPSCTNLAVLYMAGRGTEKSEAKAFGLFRKACDQRVAPACYALAFLYHQGKVVERSDSEVGKCLTTACDGKIPDACAYLGLAYFGGELGVEKSETRGFELLSGACRAKSALACQNLGAAYHLGRGVEKSDAKGTEAHARACELDPARGCAQLAVDYDTGNGVERDYGKAFELDRKACDHGDMAGCSDLGNKYFLGHGVATSREMAVKLFDRACKGHQPVGCRNLEIAKRPESSTTAQDIASAGATLLSFVGGLIPGVSPIAKAGAAALGNMSKAVAPDSCKGTSCGAADPWLEGGRCYASAADACNGKPPGCHAVKCP